MNEIEFADALVADFRSYVEAREKILRGEIESQLKELRDATEAIEEKQKEDRATNEAASQGIATAQKEQEDRIAALVAKAIAELPAPKDGEPGKDADPEVIRAMVRAAVAEIPPPADGKDADPELVAALIAKAVAEIPPAEDGRDGKDAPEIDRMALIKDVLALIPVPKDGRDGIATTDELHALINVKVAEVIDATVSKAVSDAIALMPVMVYKDVWREGVTYDAGSMVTWAGSVWHANERTTDKPGDGSKAWTLAVKRGRDGKDAR